MTHPHIMVDLETFGTRPDAAIVQVGAVRFDRDLPPADPERPHVAAEVLYDLGLAFRRNVSLTSSVLAGGSVDDITVRWWRERPPELRANLLDDAVPVSTALAELAAWVRSFDGAPVVWSNGAAFDVPILESAFRASSLPVPWSYRDVRDVRTVVALAREAGWEKPPGEVSHDALEDAVAQARWVTAALAAIRTPEPHVVSTLVDRFLAWSLPATVSVDACAATRDHPFPRSGTNLLSADEARRMVEHLLGAFPR